MENIYDALNIRPMLRIDSVVSVFYHEIGAHFSFPEEHHRCWEVCYTDTGWFKKCTSRTPTEYALSVNEDL